MCSRGDAGGGSKRAFDARQPGFVIHHQIGEAIKALSSLFEFGFDDGNAGEPVENI